MDKVTLSAMLAAVANGGAKSMVRVAGHEDRAGIHVTQHSVNHYSVLSTLVLSIERTQCVGY